MHRWKATGAVERVGVKIVALRLFRRLGVHRQEAPVCVIEPRRGLGLCYLERGRRVVCK